MSRVGASVASKVVGRVGPALVAASVAFLSLVAGASRASAQHGRPHPGRPEAAARSSATGAATLAAKQTLATATSECAAPTVQWIDQFGSSDVTVVWAVAQDGKDVYVYGDTTGALPGQSSAGGSDLFLRKYDTNGHLVWTRQFGTAGDESAFGAATMDAEDGAVYMGGFTSGTFPGHTFAGGPFDAFLIKYDADGNEVWTRQFGTDTFDDIHGVAVRNGRVLVAGSSGAALPGQPYAGGVEDGYVRRYDGDGNVIWTREFGTPGNDHPIVIAVARDAVYVGGFTDEALGGQVAAGGGDAFVRKYDERGRLQWTRQFGTPGFEETWGLAADEDAVYVHGHTDGVLAGTANAGELDFFVRKYDARGHERWTRQYGSPGLDLAGMAEVRDGVVYLAGQPGGALPGQAEFGSWDASVRTYDARGRLGFTLQYGSPGLDWANNIALGGDKVFVSGAAGGPMLGTVASGGFLDGYVLRLRVKDDD